MESGPIEKYFAGMAKRHGTEFGGKGAADCTTSPIVEATSEGI